MLQIKDELNVFQMEDDHSGFFKRKTTSTFLKWKMTIGGRPQFVFANETRPQHFSNGR